MAEKLPPSGTFGAAPANAPHEVATGGLSSADVQAQLARAQANERELAPFNPPQTGAPLPVPEKTPDIPEPDLNAAAKLLAESRAKTDHQPAASNTDSPSRGVPKPINDPGKAITGGFGSAGEAQYYALNGYELQEAVRHLMDEMNVRITNDLRFGMQITYPRLTARLRLEVEGWTEDAGFTVDKILVHDKTPLEVAKERADEVVFVLVEQLREFDDEGNPENPPDRMRDTLGLQKPAKRLIQAGATKMMVDIVPDLPDDVM